MDRKKIEKKINIALLILIAVTVVGEVIFVAYSSTHHTLGLIPIGFGAAMITVLLMDIPVFLLLSVTVSAVKELVLWFKGRQKEKVKLILSLVTAGLMAVTLVLFFLLGRITDSTANDIIYWSTLGGTLLSAVSHVVYIIRNRK